MIKTQCWRDPDQTRVCLGRVSCAYIGPIAHTTSDLSSCSQPTQAKAVAALAGNIADTGRTYIGPVWSAARNDVDAPHAALSQVRDAGGFTWSNANCMLASPDALHSTLHHNVKKVVFEGCMDR